MGTEAGFVERNPDPLTFGREYRPTARGSALSRGWLQRVPAISVWFGQQTVASGIGAAITQLAGVIFGVSLVLALRGATTDVEAGLLGASVALLACSFKEVLRQDLDEYQSPTEPTRRRHKDGQP
jgi:hypothetical protein